MNRMAFLFVVLLIANIGFGQHYTPIDEGSDIGFKIRNFGVNVSGSMKGLEGEMVFFSDSLSISHFDVAVDVKTINTGINQRDNHLRSADYLDADKYPYIRFVSSRITRSTSEEFLYVFGKLTIKDVTREISFPFKMTPQQDNLLFEGKFTLDRRDYHVGGNSLTMSDQVTVELKVMAKRSN
ncbi:MAG: YceI family protein [Chitinophagaceae bacterium]|nr:YceI family protein [Chitinophagaceae bacterium]